MLPYNAIDLRNNYKMMWFTTSLAAVTLGMINIALPLVLTYDFYLLMRAT